MNYKPRQTAFLVKVKELLEARLTEPKGEQPSLFYIEPRKLTVSRVNLTGFVVRKNPGQGYDEFMIDDGSGSILVRNFESSIAELNVGDIVRVIGRIREYNTSRYIIPEIVKRLQTKKMIELHSLEIKTTITPKSSPASKPLLAKKNAEETSPKQQVFELVKELDSENGADIQDIAAKCQLENVDAIINDLIRDGEIFKVGPSRLKVL